MAPMPLETYQDARRFAPAIRQVTQDKKMPPWFADPRYGRFSNDPSLTPSQIAIFSAWAEAQAPEGNPGDAPPPVQWTEGWNIEKPNVVFEMPQAKRIPAHGDVPYQYIIIPTHFKEDRWVRMSEIRPSNRMVVHHAVAYIRDPKSPWLRSAPLCVPFSAGDLPDRISAERRHVDDQRYIACLRPRELARSMAGRFRKVGARRI